MLSLNALAHPGAEQSAGERRAIRLIYMPDESTPTVATIGDKQAVAYLEPGEHAGYYGRLFANAPRMLDKLLDIKRLAESGEDHGYHPCALLSLIAWEARAALAFSLGEKSLSDASEA